MNGEFQVGNAGRDQGLVLHILAIGEKKGG
jgi:hypothetical protein